jgi:isochorismate pyruvate lyase
MGFDRVFTNAPWEKRVGYCRALKAGDYVHVTGTAPVDEEGKTFAPGDPYKQAQRCLQIIGRILAQMDVDVSRIVRTRMFVTDISLWREFGRAHAEFFNGHLPTTTMVEVKRLIDPQMMIEIEADAFLK